MKHAVKCKRVQ